MPRSSVTAALPPCRRAKAAGRGRSGAIVGRAARSISASSALILRHCAKPSTPERQHTSSDSPAKRPKNSERERQPGSSWSSFLRITGCSGNVLNNSSVLFLFQSVKPYLVQCGTNVENRQRLVLVDGAGLFPARWLKATALKRVMRFPRMGVFSKSTWMAHITGAASATRRVRFPAIQRHNRKGITYGGSYRHDAAIDRGRRTLRPPDPPLEPADEAVYLRRPQRCSHHRPVAEPCP